MFIISVFKLKCSIQQYKWGRIGHESEVARLLSEAGSDLEVDRNAPYAEVSVLFIYSCWNLLRNDFGCSHCISCYFFSYGWEITQEGDPLSKKQTRLLKSGSLVIPTVLV